MSADQDSPVKYQGKSDVSIAHRYRLFMLELAKNGFNAAKAAEAIGLKASSGARLMKSELIQLLVKEFMQREENRSEIKAERILLEAKRMALADPRELCQADGTLKPSSEWSDDIASAVNIEFSEEYDADGAMVGRTKKVKLFDKSAAIERAMKHLGLFEKDNTQRSENIQINIVGVSAPRA